MEKWPLGVFASIDAGLGVQLAVAHELGVPTVQLHAPHQSTRTKENADRFLARLKELGISITVVFGGFEGESYADIPTVSRTVGLVPPATRAERLKEMKEISDFAKLLGVGAVGLHIGFVPHDPSDPLHSQVVAVTRELCDHCKTNGQNLHLETGQEAADTLLEFLSEVGRDNLFVNFDPANMILYGSGEPIAALKKVGKYVRSVHCKDAKWAAKPRRGVGRGNAAGRRRGRLRDVPPHAEGNRLYRSADDRARNSPRACPAKRRNRPRHAIVERTESENRLNMSPNP